MPKVRKKKLRKVKRRRKDGNLGIFILVGFVCCILVWLIIKEPVDKTAELANPIITAENSELPVKQKKKSAIERKAISKTETKLLPMGKKTAEATADNTSNTPESAIITTIEKLGIPKSYFHKRNIENLTIFNVPIDKSEMDLIYANMIFKGELERNGATFIKGTDSTGKQTLLFGFPDTAKQYQINIFYDNKLYQKKQKKRTITIVVDDFGTIGGDLLTGFLALDREVCFSIFPDEEYSVQTMKLANEQGRLTLIHIPMEPIGYPEVNPGKNPILVQYDAHQIDKIISRFIEQLPYCEGVNNHMGSLATTDEDVMNAVMAVLKKYNKFFLDSRTTNVSVAYSVAQKNHLKSYRNDLFLDSPNISQSTMDAKLNQIIELSNLKQNVIAISHCHNYDKLDYLKRIINRLKAAGFTLIPLTDIDKYNVPEIL